MHEGCFYCRLDQLCCKHVAERSEAASPPDLPDPFPAWEDAIWAGTGTVAEPASAGGGE